MVYLIKLVLILMLFLIPEIAFAKSLVTSLSNYTHTYTPKELKPAPLLLASVCFAGQACSNTGTGFETNPSGNEDYSSSEDLCQKNGFSLTGGCRAYEKPGQVCGYNSSFFDKCCNKAYNFTAANCLYPNYLSADNCSGKKRCLCDRRLYPSTQCSSPEEPLNANDYCRETTYDTAGNAVTSTFYTGCKCPNNYQICGKNQEGVGTPCQGNSYQECKCKAGYTDACYEFGPQPGKELDYCLKDGTKYYLPKSCKTCANRGTLYSCPTGFACILEQCSAKYYVTGCNIAGGYQEIDGCDWMKCVSPFEYYEKPEE